MLCDKCKKNEANVHVSRSFNGVTYEQNLCSECAGISGDMLMGGFPGFGNMFQNFREMSMVGAPVRGIETIPTQAGNDYAELEEMGLTLPGFDEAPNNSVMEQKEETLDSLKAQLEDAVKNQAFEKAAELRDKLYFKEKEEKGKSGFDTE